MKLLICAGMTHYLPVFCINGESGAGNYLISIKFPSQEFITQLILFLVIITCVSFLMRHLTPCYVIYLVTLDSSGYRHTGFVAGGARVALRSCTAVPRMELNAALLPARAAHSVLGTFTLTISDCIYFTDSKVVLGYLVNKSKRFSG